jgi:hypothetical protein
MIILRGYPRAIIAKGLGTLGADTTAWRTLVESVSATAELECVRVGLLLHATIEDAVAADTAIDVLRVGALVEATLAVSVTSVEALDTEKLTIPGEAVLESASPSVSLTFRLKHKRIVAPRPTTTIVGQLELVAPVGAATDLSERPPAATAVVASSVGATSAPKPPTGAAKDIPLVPTRTAPSARRLRPPVGVARRR